MRGSWEPSLRRRAFQDLPAFEKVKSIAGPLEVRGNVGVDWTDETWSFGLNGQAYGPYRVTYAYQDGSIYAAAFAATNQLSVSQQGGERVSGQAYLNGYLGWRSAPRSDGNKGRELAFRLGIKNILNSRPPIVVPPLALGLDGPGYSLFGDPRERRFVLEITAGF
jgi:hypothetical protein